MSSGVTNLRLRNVIFGLMMAGTVLMVCLSCATVNRLFSNRTFKKNGYEIYSPAAEFEFQRDPMKRILTIPDPGGYNDRTYVETTGDSRVDRITYRGETYERGEEGTEEMFERADRVWREKMAFLNVPAVHERWVRKNPSRRAETRGFFQ